VDAAHGTVEGRACKQLGTVRNEYRTYRGLRLGFVAVDKGRKSILFGLAKPVKLLAIDA